MITIAAFFLSFNMMFLEPILSLRVDELGLKDFMAGYCWALEALTYSIGSLLFAFIIDKYELDPRYVILPCFVACCPSIYLLSGYKLENPYFIFVGLGLDGFFMAGISVTLYVEVNNGLDERFYENDKFMN